MGYDSSLDSGLVITSCIEFRNTGIQYIARGLARMACPMRESCPHRRFQSKLMKGRAKTAR